MEDLKVHNGLVGLGGGGEEEVEEEVYDDYDECHSQNIYIFLYLMCTGSRSVGPTA